MKDNLFGIIIGVVVVAILGVAIVAGGDDSNNISPDGDGQDILEISELDYVKGSENSELAQEPKVTVFEYGDFQCPFCGIVYPIISEVTAEYADNPDVAFVYRHFPLPSHQSAMVAHRAAEAAGRQGKFYEMHDILFENQTLWAGEPTSPIPPDQSDDIIRELAEELGLNLEQYDADFADSSTLTTINQQQKTGEEIGVNSTPTFFINQTQLEQVPRTADELRAAIEAELEKVNSAESSGETEDLQ
ncbi:TPA: hypothetical protein EYO12_03595 [Candidatus Saccharibacteria bacterium]|nr:hypothetical protein [Candidatus Saccharibacteria bacterium]HIO87885.1 hypothetical protein [Candidatus Saccharibacteria bacterium]